MCISLYLNQLSAYKFGVISHFYKKKKNSRTTIINSTRVYEFTACIQSCGKIRIVFFFSYLNIRTFIINSARVHEFTAVVRVFVFSSVHIPIGLSSKCFCWALPRKCVPAWVVRAMSVPGTGGTAGALPSPPFPRPTTLWGQICMNRLKWQKQR